MISVDDEKICGQCLRTLRTSEFAKDRTRTDGLQAYCRECRREYRRQNAEQIREKSKQYIAERSRREPGWNTSDPERLRRYRQENPDDVREYQRRYRASHDEEVRDATRGRRNRWYAGNPHKRAEYGALHRARKANVVIVSGAIDYERIYQRDGDICYLCGRKVLKKERHVDHVVPLSRGGTHTEDNLRVTHARCNLIKGAALVEELDMARFR